MLLKLNSADGGVYLQRRMKVRVMRTCQIVQEACGPGPRVAPVVGQAIVNRQASAGRKGDEHAPRLHGVEVGIVLDAAQPILIRHLILVHQDGM